MANIQLTLKVPKFDKKTEFAAAAGSMKRKTRYWSGFEDVLHLVRCRQLPG